MSLDEFIAYCKTCGHDQPAPNGLPNGATPEGGRAVHVSLLGVSNVDAEEQGDISVRCTLRTGAHYLFRTSAPAR